MRRRVGALFGHRGVEGACGCGKGRVGACGGVWGGVGP